MLYDESPYPGFSHLQIADVSLDYAIEGVPREVKGTRCQLRPNPVDRLHDGRTTRAMEIEWNGVEMEWNLSSRRLEVPDMRQRGV